MASEHERAVYEQVEDETGRTRLDRPFTAEEAEQRTPRTASGSRRAAPAASTRSSRARSSGHGRSAAARVSSGVAGRGFVAF